MNPSQIYLAVSLAALVIVALLIFFVRKQGKANRLTPLAALAFGCVLAGILFGDERFIGYGLLGVGVILALIDMLMRSKR